MKTVLVAQLCPILRPHGLYSLPGSSVHGILQARILVWVAIPFSRQPSRPKDQTLVSLLQADSLPSEQINYTSIKKKKEGKLRLREVQ